MCTKENYVERLIKTLGDKGCSPENLDDWFAYYWRQPQPVGAKKVQQDQLTDLLKFIDKRIRHYRNAAIKIRKVADDFKQLAAAPAPAPFDFAPFAQCLPLVLSWPERGLPLDPEEFFSISEVRILEARLTFLKKLRASIAHAFKDRLSSTRELQKFALFVRTLTRRRATFNEIADYWQYRTDEARDDVQVEFGRFKKKPEYRDWKCSLERYVHECPTGKPTFHERGRQLAAQYGIELPTAQKRKKRQ